MRIGVDLIANRGVHGTEVFALGLLRAAVREKRGHQWVVYVTDAALAAELAQWETGGDSVEVVLLAQGASALARAWAQQWVLPRRVQKDRIAFLYSPSPFFAWAARVPRAVTIHDCAYAKFSEYRSFVSRLYIQTCLRLAVSLSLPVYTVSEFSAQELHTVLGVQVERIALLTEGVPPLPEITPADTRQVQQHFSIQSPYFLYIGNARPRKNLRRLLTAFSLVQSKQPCSLVIIGELEKKFLDVPQVLQDLHMPTGAVVCTGVVSAVQKAVLLRGAHALVFPSLYEGFGLPVLEAQSCGVPVVTAASSSLPEVAGEGALFCEPTQEVDIARAMLQTFDPVTREHRIAAGTKNVTRFSWQTAAQIFLYSLAPNEHSSRK